MNLLPIIGGILMFVSGFLTGETLAQRKFYKEIHKCQDTKFSELDKEVVRRIPFEAGYKYVLGVAFHCYLNRNNK